MSHGMMPELEGITLLAADKLPGVLSGDQIREAIAGQPPLIAEFLDLDAQVQPNGFDLTLAEVHRYLGGGAVAVDNKHRVLPELDEVAPGPDGFYSLTPGVYHV